MVSPDAASEMVCPIVLQAVDGDMQLLLSLPFTPSTYHVLAAKAAGASVRMPAKSRLLSVSLCFIIFLLICSLLAEGPGGLNSRGLRIVERVSKTPVSQIHNCQRKAIKGPPVQKESLPGLGRSY